MRYLKKSIAVAGAAAGTATLVAGAALPANASAQRAGTRIGFERLTGFLVGPRALSHHPRVPLVLEGAVDTHGVIDLGGHGAVAHVWTFKGILTARHSEQTATLRSDFRTCRVTEVAKASYFLLGDQSTGAFRDIRGHGHATVVFSAVFPRHHRGECDFHTRPEPFSAFIAFEAEGPVSFRHHH